jgi:hypothetical protein
VFKYSNPDTVHQKRKSFTKFLSGELEVADFIMPSRNERNER